MTREFFFSGISRGGARGPFPLPLPVFVHQTEAQRAEKNVLETAPKHPPLPIISISQGLDPALIVAGENPRPLDLSQQP